MDLCTTLRLLLIVFFHLVAENEGKPLLVSKSNDQYIKKGDDFAISCLFNGNGLSASVIWSTEQYPDVTAVDGFVVNELVTGNLINSKLRNDNVVLSSSGVYKCNCTDSNGAWTVGYTNVTVKMAATIKMDPIATIALEGDTQVTLQCQIEGYPLPDVVWYKGDQFIDLDKVSITTETIDPFVLESVVTFESVDRTDSDIYLCSGSNVLNITERETVEVNSTAVLLEIYYPVEFIEEPQDVYGVVGGGDINLTCFTRGNPLSLPALFFWSNGTSQFSQSRVSITTTTINIGYESTTNSTLTISSATIYDTGEYTCEAQNFVPIPPPGDYRSIEGKVNLVIQYPPSVSTPSLAVFVNVTETVSISCVVYGIPLPDVTWSFVNINSQKTELDLSNLPVGISIISIITDVTTVVSTITLEDVSKDQDGFYVCAGTNGITNFINLPEKVMISLFVQVPPVVTAMSSSFLIHRLSGDNVTFLFTLSQAAPSVEISDIVWTHQSQNTIADVTDSSESRLFFAADRLSLTINFLDISDEGVYKITASNDAGSSCDSIELNIGSFPFISPSLNDTAVLNGTMATTFTCLSHADPIANLSWSYNEQQLSQINDKYTIEHIGDGYSILTVYNVGLYDAGMYTCTAGNVFGTVDSIAILSVQVPPAIVATTISTILSAGEDVTLVCNASGNPPPTIVWLKDETIVSDINGFMGNVLEMTVGLMVSSELQLVDLSVVDTAKYKCNVSNSLAVELYQVSEGIDLQVLQPPNVTVTPEHLIINNTDPYELSCEATGIPPPSITWRLNQSPDPLQNISGVLSILSSYETLVSGIFRTISVINIVSASKTFEGNFTCKGENTANNVIGSIEERQVFVFIQVPPMVFINGQESVISVLHFSLILSFTIKNASPPVVYEDIRWRFKNSSGIFETITSDSNPRFQFSTDLLTLTITDVGFSDEGEYKLTVHNAAGIDEETITVDVEAPPTIFPSHVEVDVIKEDDATLHCMAAAEPLHNFTWTVPDGSIASQGEKFSLTTSGQQYGSLIIHNTTLTDAGEYTCTVTNVHGNDTHTIQLNVQVPPEFVSSPSNFLKQDDESVQLSCTVYGYPLPDIQWQKDDQLIELTPSITTTITTNQSSLTVSSVLSIVNLNHTNGGLYSCYTFNDLVHVLSAISDQGDVIVNYPVKLIQIEGLSNITEGNQLNLFCHAFGRPKPTISWTGPRGNLTLLDYIEITSYCNETVDGFFSLSILTINLISYFDTGVYNCTASNSAHGDLVPVDVDTHMFSVTVLTLPILEYITPDNIIVILGDTVSLEFIITRAVPAVTPSGVEWTFQSGTVDGVHIETNTNLVTNILCTSEMKKCNFSVDRLILTLTNMSLYDEGSYIITVSNIVGNVSLQILIDIEVPAVITEAPTDLKLLLGTKAVFICVAESEPLHNTTWFFNGSLITNASRYSIVQSGGESVLSVDDVRLSDAGVYTCVVKNEYNVDDSASTLEVQVPPHFSDPVPNINGIAGGNITLQCSVFGYPVPSITWLKKGSPLQPSYTVQIESHEYINNTVTSTLSLSDLHDGDTSNYACQANNTLAQYVEVIGQEASLLVLYPPNVTVSLLSILLNESDSFSITCTSSGIPLPSLKWLYATNISLLPSGFNPIPDDVVVMVTMENSGSIVKSVLSVPIATKSHEGIYKCVGENGVMNLLGTPEEIESVVTVQVPPMVFINGQESVISVLHFSLTLSFTIKNASPPVVYEDIRWSFKNSSGIFKTITSDSNPRYHFSPNLLTLTITDIAISDEGEYKLTVRNAAGIDEETITVDIDVPAVITEAPTDLKLLLGTKAVFICVAESEPLHNTTWFFNGSLITNASRYSIVQSGGESVLSVDDVRLSDAGVYTCVVKNEYNVDDAAGTLEVQVPPQIIGPVQNINGTAGGNITLQCSAFGYPVPSITWLKKGSPLQPSYTVQIESHEYINNTVTSTLSLSDLHDGDTSNYTCQANNSLAQYVEVIGQEASLLVLYPPNVTVSSLSILLNETDSFSITCTSSGIPLPSLTWLHATNISLLPSGFNPIPDDVVVMVTMENSGSIVKSVLSVPIATKSHEGIYKCVGENGVMNLLGTPEEIESVVTVQVPPMVFINGQESVISVLHFSLTLSFTIKNASPPVVYDNIRWSFKNSSGIFKTITSDSNPRYHFSPDLLTLTITDIAISDEGEYKLTVHNAAGIDEETITVDVDVPAVITEAPTDLKLLLGTKAVFICVAESEPLHNTTWFFNESLITNASRYSIVQSGGESVLSVDDVRLSDAGVYTCVVKNEYNVDDAAGTLEVQAPPQISDPVPNINGIAGGNITLQCSAFGYPVPSITWLKEGSPLQPSYTVQIESHEYINNTVTSTLSLSDLHDGDTSNYACQANNTLAQYVEVIGQEASLLVLYPPNVTVSSLFILLNETDSFSITCTSSGIPLPALTWLYATNISLLPSGFNPIPDDVIVMVTIENSGSIVKSVLSVPIATKSHEGVYKCVGENEVMNLLGTPEEIESVVAVQVKPTLSTMDYNHDSLVDSNYAFSIRISNNPFPPITTDGIRWLLNGVEFSTNDDPHYELVLSSSTIELNIKAVVVADGGNYTLIVGNTAGNTYLSLTLTVYASPSISNAIIPPLTPLLLPHATSMKFECIVDGIRPPIVSWLFNESLILPHLSRTFDIYTENATNFRTGVPAHKSVLMATSLKENNNGSYVCKASNDNGSIIMERPYLIKVIPEYINYCEDNPCENGGVCANERSSFICTCPEGWTGLSCSEVGVVRSAPIIIDPPETTYVPLDSKVNLSCIATGYPQPVITWYKDDERIENAITPYYIIEVLTLRTRGRYSCSASNEEGMDESDKAYVKIKGLIQYMASLNLTKGYVEKFIRSERQQKRRQVPDEDFTATSDRLNRIISIINTDVLGQLSIEDVTFLSVALHESESTEVESLLDPIPLIVTLVAENGGSAALLAAVIEQLRRIGLLLDPNLPNAAVVMDIVRFDGCVAENTTNPSPDNDTSLDFILQWPETDIGQTSVLRCPCGPEGFDIGVTREARRQCIGNFEEGAIWGVDDDKECQFSASARKLCNLALLEEPDEQVDGLNDITSETEAIGSLEVSISTVFVEDLSTDVGGDEILSGTYLNVVDNLLSVNEEAIIESNEEARTAGRILESFEQVAMEYPIPENTTDPILVVHKNYALAVQEFNMTYNSTNNFIFGISEHFSNGTGIDGNSIHFENVEDPAAIIEIPSSILDAVEGGGDIIRFTHAIFDTESLFLRRRELLERDRYLKVGSTIISASVNNETIQDLQDPVIITLRKNESLKNETRGLQCSYWDPNADDGYGNWSGKGCYVINETNDEVICGCNHLTSFVLILDVTPITESTTSSPPYVEETLQYFSFIGICVSIVCLVIIILTYLIERRLRSTNNARLLLNFCFALLGLYIVFIPAVFATEIIPLCVVLSALLHYFLFTSLLAMASEATVLYIELVKVFSTGHETLPIKAIIVTWVTPIFVVGLSLAPNYKGYFTEEFCRPVEWQFWVGFIVPFGIIYIYNWIMFVIIVSSICKQQIKMKNVTGNQSLKASYKKQAVMLITLGILFGLGWSIGLLGTNSLEVQWLRYGFQIVFITLTAFQGLFVFILYGLRLQQIRKVWKKWFYIMTNQHVKAAHYDISSSRQPSTRSTKLNQKVQLGSFGDDSGKVELKSYTSYRTVSPYFSTRPESPPIDHFSSPITQDSDGPITELTVKRILGAETVGTFKPFQSNEEVDVDRKDEEINLENTNDTNEPLNSKETSPGSQVNLIMESSSYSGHKILESSLSTFSGLQPEDV